MMEQYQILLVIPPIDWGYTSYHDNKSKHRQHLRDIQFPQLG